MTVEISLRFPDQADRRFEEARKFRRLSPDERLLRILDLIASGETLMAFSPKREIARQLREKSEAEWQRAFKELFARHGVTAAESAPESADGRHRTGASP